MKTLIRILPVLLIIAACGTKKSPEVERLISERDSLLKAQLEIKKQINKVDKKIALADTANGKDNIKVIKKITMQKNRLAATQLKIRKLEEDLLAKEDDRLTPVGIKKLDGEPFNHFIVVYGKVEADNYAKISPEMGGLVKSIPVNEGQRVSKGTLLVSLNTDATDNQIDGVKTSLELATSTFEKQATLWEQGIGSEIQYLNAKTQKENLEAQLKSLKAQKEMAEIRAPFDGIVDKIYLKKGELASPGFPVVEFVNLSRMIVKADIPERFIGEVTEGQEVQLTFDPLPDLTINTPIVRIAKVIDPASRTFEIELKVTNPSNEIRPNMVSSIRINDYSEQEAMVVPSLAIRKDISGTYVYLAKDKEGETVVSKQYINTGMAYNDESLVTEGLEKGDQVIVKGYHLVSSGMPVRIVN